MRYLVWILSLSICAEMYLPASELFCLESSSPVTRRKLNTISIGMTNFSKSIDPMEAWHYQHFFIIQSTYETLVRIGESGKIISGLAESWNIDSSGTKYTFQLRPGAKFHNGKLVTSNDVAQSFARILWPDSTSVVKDRIASIIKGGKNTKKPDIPVGIQIISPTKISFELKAPYQPFLYVLSMSAFSIISFDWQTPQIPIGSGPMQPSYDSKKMIWRFRSFDQKYRDKPKLNGFDIQPIRTVSHGVNALTTGEVDLIMGLTNEDLREYALAEGIILTKSESVASIHLFFNNSKILFRNEEVRKNIGNALTQIAKDYTHPSQFVEFEPYFIPKGIMPLSYYNRQYSSVNTMALKRKRNSKKKGDPLKVILRREYFSDDLGKRFIQALNDLGFEGKISFIRAEEYPRILKDSSYDIIAGGYMGNFPDPDGFLDLISKNNSYQYGNIDSTELFQQLAEVRHLANPNNRLEEYSRILKVFEQKWYFIPLYRINIPFLHRKEIQIPPTNLRYECKLWNIYWKNKIEM
jgi:ABC-type transport system substrate-binding protein